MITLYGTVVEEDGFSPARIEIEDDTIHTFNRLPDDKWPPAIGEHCSYAMHRDKRGLPEFIIFPGFVDLNVETIEGLAAINGGITYLGCVWGAGNANPLDLLCYFALTPDFDQSLLPGDLPFYVDDSTFRRSANPNEDLGAVLAQLKGKSVTFRWKDISSALDMIEKHQIRGRVLISTNDELQEVREAKERGVDVLSETHLQYLYFDSSMITPENRAAMQVMPPLRTPEDREALLDAFKRGHVDLLTSGHISRELSSHAPYGLHGMPMLDTFGSVVAWLIDEGVEPSLIFQVACKNPGDWLAQFTGHQVGRIKEGYEANITVVAFNKPAIDSRQLYTTCGWSPFDIRTLRGSVETVFLRGEKVVNGGWMKDFKISSVASSPLPANPPLQP